MSTAAVARLRQGVVQSMPAFPLAEVLPKKSPVIAYSLEDHIMLYAITSPSDPPRPLFVQLRNQEMIPHLWLAIEYPGILRPVYVDDGAVRALLRGADLMAPGIKQCPERFSVGSVIEIRLLGTTVPFAIGVSEIESTEISPEKKGTAIRIVHLLRDGLWDLREGIAGS